MHGFGAQRKEIILNPRTLNLKPTTTSIPCFDCMQRGGSVDGVGLRGNHGTQHRAA